jgi:hypothetical protein
MSKNYFHAPMSPSQLGAAKLCLRRWAFSYRAGAREASGDAAEAGTRVHGVLETYLRDGVSVDESVVWGKYNIGAMAKTMAEHLPPAGSVTLVEQEFSYEYGGFPFTGKIDAQHEGVVFDHKTTSKPTGVKSEEKLRTDIQALIYGAYPKNIDPTLQWTTGIWSTGKAKKVRLTLLTSEAAAGLDEHVLPLAVTIWDVPSDVDPLSLPPNWDSCTMFPPRGCPHKATCGERPRTGFGRALMNKINAPLAPIEPPTILIETNQTPRNLPTRPVLLTTIMEAPKPTYPIGTLYVDCLPLERPYTLASRLIAVAAQTVCDDQQVHHVRMIDFKWGAMLAAQLVDDIRKGEFIESLVLDTRSPEGRECLQALVGVSSLVVKGL